MRLGDIFGQEKAIGILLRAIESGRIPQAYLFAGPDGVGKKTAALALAAALNCPKEPAGCGVCSSCRRVAAGNHPDVRLIEPRARIIRIDMVREISEAAGYKPFEGRKKVFVLDQVELMNQAAANCLLKTLEEPPEDTLLVLVTSLPENLLPTVRSRCQRVDFAQLPRGKVLEWLVGNGGLSPQVASLLAFLTEGSLGAALALASGQVQAVPQASSGEGGGGGNGVLKMRDGLVEWLLSLTGQGHEQEGAGRMGQPQVVDLAQALAADKEGVDLWLGLLLCWYRDLVAVKCGVEEEMLANRDRLEVLRKMAGRYSVERLLQDVEVIQETYDGLRLRVNARLALENMFLRLGAGL